ncbi:MAG: fibronectin type III domain-containing protein [Clostridia bacterium]|nr:fibronectin type III domain-containing protein [Clostridia bacterium]
MVMKQHKSIAAILVLLLLVQFLSFPSIPILQYQKAYAEEAQPDTLAPTAPSDLVSLSKTQSTVELSWSGSLDNICVTEYDVYSRVTVIASVYGTSYTVAGLTPGTKYDFMVKARDAAGNISESSNLLSVTTLASVAVPTNIIATAVSSSEITVSWSAVDGASGYDIEVDGSVVGQPRDFMRYKIIQTFI